MSLAYLSKTPAPPPAWVALFKRGQADSARFADTVPSRRALLVAEALIPASDDAGRPETVRLVAVVLDDDPAHYLYDFERQVSPGAPIETVDDHIHAAVDRVLRGA